MAGRPDQVTLAREELRLRSEIARHELRCLLEDDADMDAVDAKLDEYLAIGARQDALERSLDRTRP